MRTFLFSLLAALSLVISAEAQTQTRAHVKHVPALAKNLFMPGITVDMTREDVGHIAARAEWTLLEETPGSLRYETEPVRSQPTRFPFSKIYTILFNNGKAYAVTSTMSGSPELEEKVIWTFDVISAMMEKRAATVRIDKTRRIMTHAIADGRTMRVVWNQVSTTQAEVEASIEIPDQGALPLK